MAKKNFSNNPLSTRFVASLPEATIETSKIEKKCKLNLSYFDGHQSAGQGFPGWTYNSGNASLTNLLEKFKEYTQQPLNYWQNQRVGGGGLKVLEYYGDFPSNSDFTHPRHVPADAHWARFRLGNKVRLVGFVISKSAIKDLPEEEQDKFDQNTFYVVFLDKEHKFYKTEAP
ncbi:hypothetical protein [Vibrio splendidus]|uniref:hypothetical protein n=1 Tax=Vibrio splendidus TaxID=29497 RepID=UPI00031260C3|nr:hypothetical protein [Vibrio splendidus]OED83706.1 hypothetical protein A144_16055 [Vibrio splendidus ZF-90]PTP33759.1 hypothetical protein CWN95_15705 [Vibrio splendidus]